jgi:hypothetical protein
MSTTETRTTSEEYRTRGDNLLARVKELIREGNVRRIIIKNDHGTTILELPLTVGVIGAALAPALAAIGAIAALVTDCTIEVQRETKPEPADLVTQDEVPDDQC